MEFPDKADEVDSAEILLRRNRRRRQRLLFLVFGGAVGLVMLVIGSYQMLEFMDSTDFCGRLCHDVMYPEFTTYEASPHSRVECVDCHVGSGASYLVKSKASGVPQMFASLFNTFSRPISTPVENLRPARETCEACHWPEKFSGDLVRTHRSYLPDEENTEQVDTRIFKVGGGGFDSAEGIHWHIGAEVWYLPLDDKRREIAWVGVEVEGGGLQVYVDPKLADEATPERLAAEKRLMDCADCHNRATHIFYSPEELIDMALAEGSIDLSLPFIKREGLEALDPANPSLEQAIERVRAIEEFYRTSYPEVHAENEDLIDRAIVELEEVARLTTFAEMKVDWQTHFDFVSHEGCFRCHGELIAVSGDQKGEPIDAGCNLCHDIL